MNAREFNAAVSAGHQSIAASKSERIKLLEHIIEYADTSSEHSVSVADLTCMLWVEKGLCPYCGGGHQPDACVIYQPYVEELNREGDI